MDSKILGAESDRLRLICNLAYLNDTDKEYLDKASEYKDHADTDFTALQRDFGQRNPNEADFAYDRLIYEIRKESPGFAPKIERRDLRQAFFVQPLYSNSRIRAQAGGFLVFAFTKEYEEIQKGKSEGIGCKSFLIKQENKKKILQELDELNINEMTLFPEMEHATGYLKQKYRKRIKQCG